MNSYTVLLVLFFSSQSLGQDLKSLEIQEKESILKEDILKRLSSPNDTVFQSEAKDVIAEYLVSTVLEENEIQAFRRDKDKPHHKPPHKPHTDFRDFGVSTASPIISNQQQVVAASNPIVSPVLSQNSQVVNPSVVQSAPQDSVSRQEVTQVPILTAAPPSGQVVTAAPVQQTQQPVVTVQQPIATAAPVSTVAPITRPTVDPAHVYNQVDKILGSVATGNIVGIVDESLAIRAPTPVRNFVTGILKVIFCNPIDRLFGRCRPNSSGQISSVQGG